MIKRDEKKRRFAEISVLTAIVVALQLVGNAIRIGEFSISLILLPVVVGAVLCGPLGGAWLGFVFGTVVILAGETDAFLAISPFYTVIGTSLRGALAGLASGIVYSAASKKKDDLAIILASVAAPVMNTVFFIIFALLFFYDVFEGIMGTGNVVRGMIRYYVSINFLIELSLNMVLAPMLVSLAKRLEKQSPGQAHGGRKRLATRLVIAVILLGVLICTVSSNSGYRNFKNSMEKQYNDTAYQIAETVKSYLDPDSLRKYAHELDKIRSGEKSIEDIASLTESEEYINTQNAIASLRETMGADIINVSAVDMTMLAAGPNAFAAGEWTPLTCIFDSCSSSGICTSFGCSGTVASEFADIIANSLESNQRPDSLLITGAEGSESTEAVLGVYDESSEELLAVITVSVPMGALESAVRSDITNSIVMMICIEVIFITLYFYYITYRVIEPIKIISGEVSGFVEGESSGASIREINTRDEIQQLAEDIVKMEKDIGDYIASITSITAEKERIGAELNVAAKIQSEMLPSDFTVCKGRKDFDISASMTPAKAVGGDFYDFFPLDEDHLALVIADVSDKGVPAALFMVVAKTLLKNQSSFTRSPKHILEAVNNQLCENNTSKMFVTAWICIFEISTGKCIAANAGHEYPAIRKANGDFELLEDSHGFVLGGVKNMRYSEYEFNVEKGGTVFVYTDGVTEAENTAEEPFGTERMVDALNIDSKAAPAEIIANVKSSIEAFAGDAPQFDDITMLCIKRT